MKKIILMSIPIISFLIIIVVSILLCVNDKEPFSIDASVRDFFYDIRGEKDSTISEVIAWCSDIFGKYFLIGLAVVGLGVSILNRKGLFLSVGLGFCFVVNNIIKLIIDRERPFADLRWASESSSSFPSGHSMNSMFVYIIGAYLLSKTNLPKWMKIANYVLGSIIILFVAFSRMYLGVHYISDVVCGLLGGLGCIFIVIMAYQFYEKKRLEKMAN